jgi:DUF3040 family protein
MMPFNRKERRAFRDIEEHLADEDPALARLLGGSGPARPGRVVRRVRRWALTAAVTLVVSGMLLNIAGFIVGGLFILTTIPVLLAIVWHHCRSHQSRCSSTFDAVAQPPGSVAAVGPVAAEVDDGVYPGLREGDPFDGDPYSVSSHRKPCRAPGRLVDYWPARRPLRPPDGTGRVPALGLSWRRRSGRACLWAATSAPTATPSSSPHTGCTRKPTGDHPLGEDVGTAPRGNRGGLRAGWGT